MGQFERNSKRRFQNGAQSVENSVGSNDEAENDVILLTKDFITGNSSNNIESRNNQNNNIMLIENNTNTTL